MKRVTIGVLLCISALILLQENRPFIGIPAFIVGIILMYGWRPRR